VPDNFSFRNIRENSTVINGLEAVMGDIIDTGKFCMHRAKRTPLRAIPMIPLLKSATQAKIGIFSIGDI
jgi:hypothetical protein